MGKNIKEFLAYTDKLFLFTDFAKDKGYIKEYWCTTEKTHYLELTPSGLSLTDNLIFPFTPVTLWKEIWKEHKIIITPIYLIVAGIFGGTIVAIGKVAHALISKLS